MFLRIATVVFAVFGSATEVAYFSPINQSEVSNSHINQTEVASFSPINQTDVGNTGEPNDRIILVCEHAKFKGKCFEKWVSLPHYEPGCYNIVGPEDNTISSLQTWACFWFYEHWDCQGDAYMTYQHTISEYVPNRMNDKISSYYYYGPRCPYVSLLSLWSIDQVIDIQIYRANSGISRLD